MTATAETLATGLSAHLQAGDFIVGTFGKEGRRLSRGNSLGSAQQVAEVMGRIQEHALRRGSLLPGTDVKAKKMRKGRNPPAGTIPHIQEETPTSSFLTSIIPQNRFVIVFVSALGRIKVKVLAILDEPGSIILVFKDEDEVIFEPKVGEELKLEFSGKLESVMYPGYLHTWTDGVTKLMVLAKHPGATTEAR